MPFASVGQVGGKSVVWNQMCPALNTYSNFNGITITKVSDGAYNISGTVAEPPAYGQFAVTPIIIFKRDGRKYLLMTNTDFVNGFGVTGYNAKISRAYITSLDGSSDWAGSLFIYANQGDVMDYRNVWFAIYDLRQMFGEAVEATIKSPEDAFALGVPQDYRPYSAPVVKSADVKSIKGKNSISIPSSVRSLDGYGWSAGIVYNYIDLDRKVFVKRVGKNSSNEMYVLDTPTETPIDLPSNILQVEAGGTIIFEHFLNGLVEV